MSHSKIEWLRNADTGEAGYSINPIKGICEHNCPYCYAIRQYKRFKWNPAVRLDLSVFDECKRMKAGSKVFVCSTHDLFGLWISQAWQEAILELCAEYPKLTFIILTKAPLNLWKHRYPDNIWLGVSVENQFWTVRIKGLLSPQVKAKTKFVSFEPLQGEIHCDFSNHLLGTENQKISWAIIGTETGNRKDKIIAKYDWITSLLYEHPDTPFFLKDNLNYCLPGCNIYQEFP